MTEQDITPVNYQEGWEAEQQALEMALIDDMQRKEMVHLGADGEESEVSLRRADTAATLVQIVYEGTILDSVLMSNVASTIQFKKLIDKRVRDYATENTDDGIGVY